MAGTVLLEKQVIDGFTEAFDGVYTVQIESEGFTVGKRYKIEWDDVVYYCTCKSALFPCVGNESYIHGGNNPGEPFAVASGNNIITIYTRSTASSHTVAVSLDKKTTESNSPKYILDGFTTNGNGVYRPSPTYIEIESESLFVEGERYKIVWDDVEWYCTCKDGWVGNRQLAFGKLEPGEPFCMTSFDGCVFFYTSSTASSHTVYVSPDRRPIESISSKYTFRIKRIWRHIGFSKIRRTMRHTVELGKVQVKRVWDMFIFFKAISNVFMKLESVMISAAASEMDADKKAQTEMNAPLADHPAKDMEAKSSFASSFSVKLRAYMRAPAVTIANIFTSIKTILSASVGSVFKHQTETPMIHDSEMESADSSILKYTSKFRNEIKADGIAADSGVASAEDESISELKAAASANKTATANMNGTTQNEHYSRVNTWYYPEVVDGVLYIRQVYEATETENGTLEVK